MWVVYQKKNRAVVGMGALSHSDPEKRVAIDEVVKGLVDAESPDKYDAVQISDADQALALLSAPFRHVAIGEARGKPVATVAAPAVALLLLKSDVDDVHPVDGIGEIKADGSAFTTITVQKIGENGEAQKSKTDNDEVHLRTTEGTLMSADGKEAITSLKLKQGAASFRLVSAKARRVATVSAISANPDLHDGSIRIEFI